MGGGERKAELSRALLMQTQMTYQLGVNACGVIYAWFERKMDFPMSGGLKKACEKEFLGHIM